MIKDAADLRSLLNGEDTHPDVRQTHISIVYLTTDFAYKRLKPVRFAFLDFSTREARYAHLANEARLNRRLALDIYLCLVPIWRSRGRWELSGSGPPDEWLLAMKRLPADATLEVALQTGTLTATHLDRVMAALVEFFSKAACSKAISQNGRPAVIRRNLTENHDILREAEENRLIEGESVGRLRSSQLQALALLDDEILKRIEEDRIRDAHGDLRGEHIYLTSPIRIVDCIAFNHRLRWIDVADDVSFLATDLIRLGAESWAAWIVERYRSLTADSVSDRLLSFYRSYRFSVRAKVSLLRVQERQAADRHAQLLTEAIRFLDLAILELAWIRPWFVIVCGLSGTGKTTLGHALSERIGAVPLSSDRLRKELSGLAPTERGDASLYTPDMHDRTYSELRVRAEKRLRAHTGVVLDATFLRRSDRASIISLGDRLGIAPLFVECRCDDSEIERRLERRTLRNDDASDATLDVWRMQRSISDDYAELPAIDHVVVDTSQSSDRIVDEIVSRLKGR